MLNRLFNLSQNGTTVSREIIAGTTTFLTMAYIIFVNPQILSASGMDQEAVFVATCLAAAIGSAIMGLYANYPIALAPGMGLNAYFTYGVVLGAGYSWQAALGAVFISGLLFVALSLFPVREWIINAIPRSLKIAISSGIGLFLAIIALENAGLIADHPATLVTLGDIKQPGLWLAGVGFALMAALSHRRIPGAILLVILGITAASILLGLSDFKGITAMPPSIMPTLGQMDIAAALEIGMLAIIFTFLFFDLFDTAGTLVGVAHRGGLLDQAGRLPRLRKALLADSLATVAGASLGTSPTTSYIESASGISAGGRTGLTAVVVAILFCAALFFSPLAASVPAYATAPALLFVACLMTRGLAEIDWDDLTDVAPAIITATTMPLTFSIATGIGLGFITYVVVKLCALRVTDLTPGVVIIAAAFLAKFIWL